MSVGSRRNGVSRDYKAIVFDIDGTLYSNLFMFLSAPHVYIRNALWIHKFAKMRKKLRSKIEKNSPDNLSMDVHVDFFDESVSIFVKIVKCTEVEAKILLRKHIYDAWISAVKKVPLRYGMRLLLGSLRRNGYKLGILSDFRAHIKIEQWGLIEYFDSIICAEDYGVLKPNPKIFLEMSKSLNCDPEDIVFVGNHLYYDGIGAAQSNMESLVFHKKKLNSKILKKYNIKIFHSMLGLSRALRNLGIKVH